MNTKTLALISDFVEVQNWQMERQKKIDALDWQPVAPQALMEVPLVCACFIRTKKEGYVKCAILKPNRPAMPMVIRDSSVLRCEVIDYLPSFSELEFFYHGRLVSRNVIKEFAVIPDDWEFFEE